MCECYKVFSDLRIGALVLGGAGGFVRLGAWRLVGEWQIAHSLLPSKPRIERSLHLVRASATYC
jgi:hypothetical protein